MNDNITAILIFATLSIATIISKLDLPTSKDKGPSSVTLIKECDSIIILTNVLTYVPAEVIFEIKDFRPFVQDIVKSCYKHRDIVSKEYYQFKGQGFSLWVANGYDNFKLYSPVEIEFNPDEKLYLWNMYNDWQPNVVIEY